LLREYSRKLRDYGLLVDVPWRPNIPGVRSILQTLQNVTDGWRNERSNGACARWRFDATWHGPSCLIKPGLRALNEVSRRLAGISFCRVGGPKYVGSSITREPENECATLPTKIGLDNPIERTFPTREAAISAASTNHWRQYVAVQAAVRWGATPCSGVRRLAQTALGARRRCLESRVRQLAQRTPKCAPRCFPAAVRRVSAGYRTTYGTTAGRGRHWRYRAPG